MKLDQGDLQVHRELLDQKEKKVKKVQEDNKVKLVHLVRQAILENLDNRDSLERMAYQVWLGGVEKEALLAIVANKELLAYLGYRE